MTKTFKIPTSSQTTIALAYPQEQLIYTLHPSKTMQICSIIFIRCIEKELRARGDANALSKTTLDHYLKSEKETFVAYKKARMQRDSVWVNEFKYSILQERYDIDLLVSGVDVHQSI